MIPVVILRWEDVIKARISRARYGIPSEVVRVVKELVASCRYFKPEPVDPYMMKVIALARQTNIVIHESN